MKDQCIKVPKYKCNKAAGNGCLGCMKYNFYSAGYQDGRVADKPYKDLLFLIKSKNVDCGLIKRTKTSDEYNSAMRMDNNWNYDKAKPYFLTPEQHQALREFFL